jgi:uncharacterized DUF497 family protein
MRFEWDEAKRLTNIAKHGIDFLRARNVFAGRPRVENESWHAGETRRLRIAMLDERLLRWFGPNAVWTESGLYLRG